MAEETRNQAPQSLGESLKGSIEKLGKMRETMTEIERNPPANIVQFRHRPLAPPKPTITMRDITKTLMKIDAIWRPLPLDEEQMILRYQIFFDVLKTLSPLELEVAVKKYLETNAAFGPAPGQLLTLAR